MQGIVLISGVFGSFNNPYLIRCAHVFFSDISVPAGSPVLDWATSIVCRVFLIGCGGLNLWSVEDWGTGIL